MPQDPKLHMRLCPRIRAALEVHAEHRGQTVHELIRNLLANEALKPLQVVEEEPELPRFKALGS